MKKYDGLVSNFLTNFTSAPKGCNLEGPAAESQSSSGTYDGSSIATSGRANSRSAILSGPVESLSP